MNYIKWNPTPKNTKDNEPGPYIFNSTSDVKTPSLQYVNYNNNNMNDINIFNNNNNLQNDINKQILNDYCDLNYKSHIIFYINPKSKLVNKLNWANGLSKNFNPINYFGTNTEISFKIKYEYYQIYIDVPPQIASSKDWNKQAKSLWKMAEIYNNSNNINNTIIPTTDTLFGVRKWTGKQWRKISFYFSGQTHLRINQIINDIPIREMNDSNSQMEQRMHEIPKCWCCFRIPCNLSNCKRLNYSAR
jgi:hypothetical protein